MTTARLVVRSTTALTALALALTLGGCSKPPKRQPPPPPQVTVQKPLVQDVTVYRTFTGRTESFEHAEVRARVEGVLLEVKYDERLDIEAGTTMFLIDPAPFVASRDAAKAEVDANEAAVRLADTTARKLEKAYETRSVSELQALEARAQHEVAVARLEVSKKQLAIRELDLSYTTVTAPISGRAVETEFVVGSLVGSIGSDSLTTIVDNTKIRVWFSVDDRTVLNMMDHPENADKSPVIELQREGDKGFDFRGELDYYDPGVNTSTGTLRMRAVFDNSEEHLVPGLFVRVRIAMSKLPGATIVPEVALAADQAGRHLLVVGADDVVERRPVELGALLPEGRVILSGITADDRVVTSGLLRARPGAKVSPRTSEESH